MSATKTPEPVVMDTVEIVQQYTPCEELRQQRRSIATYRGSNVSNGYTAFKNGIHIGVIDQQTYCRLSDHSKAPMCQTKTKFIGNADIQMIQKYGRKREEWTTRGSVEQQRNMKRIRTDQQQRKSCAMAQEYMKDHATISMPGTQQVKLSGINT